MNIKTILAAATLFVVAASSPALAKTTHKTTHTHKTSHHVSRHEVRPVDAYAAVYPNVRMRRANQGSNDVYDVRGHYIGSDPDATVRDQLARDPSQGS